MHLDQHVSLKPYNTFGMEARARYFIEPKSRSEILTLLNYRSMIRMPFLVLGGGSNVLFTGNFEGLVIHINSKGIQWKEDADGTVLVTAEAGELWDDLVSFCVGKGWGGLENLSLIPGTVGAAPVQNIGAYGVEVKDCIESVHYVMTDNGKEMHLKAGECQFGYRDSIFRNALKGRCIILDVTFRLSAGVSEEKPDAAPLRLDYGTIRKELEDQGISSPTIADVRDVVCAIRRRKLPDPAEIGNAGSFFRNPVVDETTRDRLLSAFPTLPWFPDTSGKYKIPAAWLIQECGWKGFRDGDAGVHAMQPLVLVNYGLASGGQITALMQRIIESVQDRFGILMRPEVNII